MVCIRHRLYRSQYADTINPLARKSYHHLDNALAQLESQSQTNILIDFTRYCEQVVCCILHVTLLRSMPSVVVHRLRVMSFCALPALVVVFLFFVSFKRSLLISIERYSTEVASGWMDAHFSVGASSFKTTVGGKCYRRTSERTPQSGVQQHVMSKERWLKENIYNLISCYKNY